MNSNAPVEAKPLTNPQAIDLGFNPFCQTLKVVPKIETIKGIYLLFIKPNDDFTIYPTQKHIETINVET